MSSVSVSKHEQGRPQPHHHPHPEAQGAAADASPRTFEELRALAIQLRIRDAELKSHRELLELFGY